METINNILFITPFQYGYNTDSYHYCELLTKTYNVFYIGIDCGKETIYSLNRVNVYSITKASHKWKRFKELFGLVLQLQRKYKFKKNIVFYFPFCSLLLLILTRSSTIMDIRTSSIFGKYKAFVLNTLLRIESYMFKRVTIISDGLIDFLKLQKSKCDILPLGGEFVDFFDRKEMRMSLLYVGTLYDRHVEKTIEGLALFLKKNPTIYVKYTIIGVGTIEDVDCIKNTIKNNSLENNVFFAGEKRYKELLPYYKTHDVGVSYIPMKTYYDCQPPTKTYEYLLNGMVVVATPTSENKKVINQSNGILLSSDSIQDFTEGLENLKHRIKSFKSSTIYMNAQQYSWEQIVKMTLINILMKE